MREPLRRDCTMTILETIAILLQSYRLCDHCLGRQFGNVLSGLTNKQRGAALRYLASHPTMLLQLKERLMQIYRIPTSESQLLGSKDGEAGRAVNTCQLLEQDFGASTFSEFINAFLLYVSMSAEIALRRDQSVEAFKVLDHLAKQGFSIAEATMRKTTVKAALENLRSQKGGRDLFTTSRDVSPPSCRHCFGVLEDPSLVAFFRLFLDKELASLSNMENEIMDGSFQDCELCEGFFDPQTLEKWCDQIEEHCQHIEFNTFVVGSVVPPALREREDEIQANHGLSEWAEIIKSEINREIGKRLLQRWESVSRTVNVKFQDVVILLNLMKNRVELDIHPVFIEGRYCKYVRNIPQSHWPCRECEGRGCPSCDFTGKRYPTSVAELIINPILPLFEAKDGKFHGAGREDIDARMLGDGRPFVLEIIEPRKRTVDLEVLERVVNEQAEGKIKVTFIKFTTRNRLRQLKGLSSKTSKTYLAIVEVHGKPIDEILSKKSEIEDFFKKKVIEQWTPRRVLHRRANKLRQRTVHSLEILGKDSNHPGCLQVQITCDGGLYVKELINGDDGRTQPNFSQIIKAPARVVALDVLAVLIDEHG